MSEGVLTWRNYLNSNSRQEGYVDCIPEPKKCPPPVLYENVSSNYEIFTHNITRKYGIVINWW